MRDLQLISLNLFSACSRSAYAEAHRSFDLLNLLPQIRSSNPTSRIAGELNSLFRSLNDGQLTCKCAPCDIVYLDDKLTIDL